MFFLFSTLAKYRQIHFLVMDDRPPMRRNRRKGGLLETQVPYRRQLGRRRRSNEEISKGVIGSRLATSTTFQGPI
jgi:hypothetical protein